MSPLAFPPADLAALEGAYEIEIETRAAPDGPLHSTIIWVVSDGPDAFIRSVNGATARWYREARGNLIEVKAGDRRLPARAVPAVDADSIARTSAGFTRKYAAYSDMPSMIEEDILDTTLRLEPV